MSIFYIFILNTYYGSSRLESVRREQENINQILVNEKVNNKIYRCLFDLNKKDLLEAINQLIETDEFKKATQIFFIWSGHGLEDVNKNAIAITTNDNQLLFFNKFLSDFFHNIKKNIYMIVDTCRTDKEIYKDDTLHSILVDGDFIMLNGTSAGISSRGDVSTEFINKILELIIKLSCDNSHVFIKLLKRFIMEELYDVNIRIIKYNYLVKSIKDKRELIQPTIYMNAMVRNNKAMKEDIDIVLSLTGQSIESIASTKIGISKACQSIIDESKGHKHTIENCYKIIKKCNIECKHNLKELRLCEKICFAYIKVNNNLKIIDQLILFNKTQEYIEIKENIIQLSTLYSNLELSKLFKQDNQIKQIVDKIVTNENFQDEFTNYNIFNIIKSKILLPIIPDSKLMDVLKFEEYAKIERSKGNEIKENLRDKYIKIFESLAISRKIIEQMKSFNIVKILIKK